MFKGYCFIERGGKHCPPVHLKDASEVYSYVSLQKKIFPEVRITDDGDCIVVQAIAGKIVFPPEWVKMEQFQEGGEHNTHQNP